MKQPVEVLGIASFPEGEKLISIIVVMAFGSLLA
jgi:hypothetical protein